MRWLVAILFLLPIFCNAQKRVPCCGTSPTDTAYIGRTLRVDSGLYLPNLPAGDINDAFLVIHADGTVGYGNDGTFYKFRSDSTGSTGYGTRRWIDSFIRNNTGIDYRITIFGQSNAIGRADTADLHSYPLNQIPFNIRAQFDRVYIYDKAGKYVKLQLAITNRGYNTSSFGVEIALAYKFLLSHKTGTLFIDKQTIDGAPINSFLKGTVFYDDTLSVRRTRANNWLDSIGYEVKEAGIIFLQGESDYTSTSSVYKTKLDQLFNDMRTDGYIDSQTRIIISGISTSSILYGAGVDSAFKQFVAERPLAYYLNNNNTPLKSDTLHYNGIGNFIIGCNSDVAIFNSEVSTEYDTRIRALSNVTVANVSPDTNNNIPLTKSDISLGNVENTALSTWAGSTNITTIGTISTGAWNATAIPINKGGTGVTAVGTANQVLATNSTATGTEWQTISSGGASTSQVDSMAASITPNVPHRKGKLIMSQTTGSGDLDLYTCPAGKKAWVSTIRFYNTSGSTVSAYGEVKIGGTYYRLTNTQSVTTTASQSQAMFFCFSGGQSLSVNATGTGLNVFAEMIEFDSATGFKTVYITGCATGDQTLYTVPTGKSATVLGGLPVIYNGGGAMQFVSDAGGTRTIYFNAVPSGGSPSSSNQLRAAFGVTASGRATLTDPISLGAGDYININVSTGNAAQIAWVNVIEWSN